MIPSELGAALAELVTAASTIVDASFRGVGSETVEDFHPCCKLDEALRDEYSGMLRDLRLAVQGVQEALPANVQFVVAAPRGGPIGRSGDIDPRGPR
jgi:hypothetical protein